jgi:CheY-like chemotaxis protein
MTATKGKIISIEDSDTDFMALRFALETSGVNADLERFTTGGLAISEVGASCPCPRRSTVILLDLNLPGVDGRQVLKAVRDHHQKRDVPVIVLSTSSHPRDIEFCQKAGANAYVVKPFELDDWGRKIGPLTSYWLAKAARMGDPPVAGATTPGNRPILDRSQLIRAIESEIIPRLLLAHGNPSATETQNAILSDEIDELARLAFLQDITAATALVERLQRPGITLEMLFKSHIAPAARLVGDLWKAEMRTFGEFERALNCLQELLVRVNPPDDSDKTLH